MNPHQKSTGWKVPFLFCVVILALVYAASFLKKKPEIPELPQELMRIASATHLNLDNSDGKAWQTLIRDSAAGFQGNEIKDGKLAEILDAALASKRFDAACAAFIHIRDEKMREEKLKRIHTAAIKNCPNLQWSVFAIHSSRSQESIDQMSHELLARWHECRSE